MPRASVKTSFPKKRTAAALAKNILSKAINQARGVTPVPRARQALMLQAVRTGGWSNPSTAETKFIDVSQAATATTSGAWSSLYLLNGTIQGTEAVNRLGRKITMTSLYLKLRFALASTTTQGGFLRVAVVYDKQANGTAPSITDIYLSNNYLSPNNLSNRDRFVKIIDKEIGPLSAQADFAVPLEEFRKLMLETTYNTGNAGTIGDITTGSLYLLVADSGTFATAQPTFSFQSRIKFTDH